MKKFIFFFFFNLLVHLPFINLPPCGTHVWRQCNTLAMSRNFAEEDMNILKPRIDRRNDTDGITGSHFPLYEWLLAAFAKVFGFSDLLARLFSLLVFSFAMLAFYKLLIHFKIGEFTAVVGTLLLLSIPEFYYHSINALPDVLALCLSLFGLLNWLKYKDEAELKFLIPAIVFSVLGGLVKLQFLMIPLAVLAIVPLNIKNGIKYALIWAGIGSVVFIWYYYALELTRAQNLKEYGLWIKPVSLSYKWETLKGNLLMDLPEVLLGWPMLITFLYLFFKNMRSFRVSSNTLFAGMWLLMFSVFYFVAIERMQQHSYYFMPLLPLSVFVFIQLALMSGMKKKFLVLVLVFNFIWAFVRIVPSRWVENKLQIPKEFADTRMREEFSRVIPPNSKCVVGPDISGCIFFYFTHTKGYSFEQSSELVKVKEGRMDIDNMRAAGMQYLIIRDGTLLLPYMSDIKLKGRIATIGEFEIWEL